DSVIQNLTVNHGVNLILLAIIRLMLVTILTVLPAFLIIWLVSNKYIVKPINSFIQITRVISMGNLGQRVPVLTTDELGQLAQNINTLVQNSATAFQNMANYLRDEKLKERELAVANEKLQQLDKLKDEFVSIASHELRTPMTAIKGLISMIFEGDFGPINKQIQDPLNDIATSTERLIELINDMLDVSRIEAGRLRLTFEDVSLNSIILEMVKLLQPLARQKGIELKAEPFDDRKVRTDPGKAREVLNNLIGNSIKFTDKGEIMVKAGQRENLMYVFVSDTGLGISKENQQKLFNKFSQVSDNQLGRPRGTGLGLYISREFARKMGGELWIERSEPGKGTTFAFTLPLTPLNQPSNMLLSNSYV
ncbi:MAG: sensory transduction histidine kinase, partial [Microgenomates group bacterium Gr01-1014_80]